MAELTVEQRNSLRTVFQAALYQNTVTLTEPQLAEAMLAGWVAWEKALAVPDPYGSVEAVKKKLAEVLIGGGNVRGNLVGVSNVDVTDADVTAKAQTTFANGVMAKAKAIIAANTPPPATTEAEGISPLLIAGGLLVAFLLFRRK